MRIQVKICGITAAPALAAAVQGGAAFVGFVFHAPSPRHLTLAAAAGLRQQVPPGVRAVALVVDANDATLAEIGRAVRPDIFQLQGSESPQRTAEIRALTSRPVIKALPVAREEDVSAAFPYEDVGDFLMFDAKAPAGAPSPGGGGQSFDWKLLAGRSFRRPWFLAGGLTAANIKAAVEASGARLLDVSSGVERARGEKDPALIRAFLDTARAL
jgi:phosphoribosylanthranilate isomerase